MSGNEERALDLEVEQIFKGKLCTCHSHSLQEVFCACDFCMWRTCYLCEFCKLELQAKNLKKKLEKLELQDREESK